MGKQTWKNEHWKTKIEKHTIKTNMEKQTWKNEHWKTKIEKQKRTKEK